MEHVRHTDQMNREIWLPAFPQRIVSLVPSQTEYLCTLGIGKRLVGRTLFCIHPEEGLKDVSRVGGTKKLQLDKIRALQPDLIIGNKEENDQEQIELLSKDFPVWMSDIYHPKDAMTMMLALGGILNLKTEAESIVAKIESGMLEISKKSDRFKGINVFYAIWKSPWMFAGKDTFIDSMLSLAGFTNLCDRLRYPEWSEKEIIHFHPDLLLLSSEPYPFSSKHIRELESILPESRAILVDGEMFSWYGSRMLDFPAYLETLFTELHKKTP